jgi:hypothetical protein
VAAAAVAEAEAMFQPPPQTHAMLQPPPQTHAQRRLRRSYFRIPRGGTNTKKYRRRNKRKTKHYKNKAKRYTKKRNMRY